LLQLQGGKCLLCGAEESESKRRLSVDHNHMTGAIRGLLCSMCNAVVGWAERVTNLDEIKDYVDNDIVSQYGDIFESQKPQVLKE